MDFGKIELDDDHQSFQDEISALLDGTVVERGPERRRFGADEVFDPVLIRKLVARGLAMPGWPVGDGGAGRDRLHDYILAYELHRRGIDDIGTEIVWSAVERFGQPDLVAELKPKVATGEVRFSVGYTEPDGGSDIAAATTRAVRDGNEWVINGSKMFTTHAHMSEYVFLITRTDPEKPKHRGLTMFLVPTDWPGVEIHPLHTLGDERTNVTYYGDVRLSDRYRLGAVDDGWTVLRGPLDEEARVRTGERRAQGVDGELGHAAHADLCRLRCHRRVGATSVRPDGSHPIDDPSVRMRLGRVAADIEMAMCAQGPLGRVVGGEVNVRAGAELSDIVGPEALLPYGADGAIDGGDIERSHQFAQPTITYGGSVEVFRQMIAQHVLGLPRPSYPGTKNLVSTPR